MIYESLEALLTRSRETRSRENWWSYKL